MDIKSIEDEFNRYLGNFDMNNSGINYKYFHSYRVEALSKILSMRLFDIDYDVDLATTIGLLHDIGRFRQLEMFGSFSDVNIDHADLGVKILFDDGLIKNFPIDNKYYDIIYFAIKNHNKYEIETCPYEDYLHHAMIIRDTDKIDILDMHTRGKLPIRKDGSMISDKVSNEFYQNKTVNKSSRRTMSDVEILRMALLFDINFDESYDIILDKGIIDNYYSLLSSYDKFRPYLDHVSEYVKKRSKRKC